MEDELETIGRISEAQTSIAPSVSLGMQDNLLTDLKREFHAGRHGAAIELQESHIMTCKLDCE